MLDDGLNAHSEDYEQRPRDFAVGDDFGLDVCSRQSNDCTNELTILGPESTMMVYPCLRRHYHPAATSRCDIGSRIPSPTDQTQSSDYAMNDPHMVLLRLYDHTHVLWNRFDEYHGLTHK